MALEDFTTYALGSSSTELTILAASISWNEVLRGDDDCYAVKDKGVAFFNGDFTHTFEFTTPSAAETDDGSWVYVWLLSNAANTPAVIDAANGDYLGFYFVNATGDIPRFALTITDDGVNSADNSNTINFSTKYYVTIMRDDDGGVNGTGRLTAYICTGNYYNEVGYTLFDTLTLDCGIGEQNDYRYIFATIPRGGVGTQATDGVVENFNLAPAIYVYMAATGGGTGGGSASLMRSQWVRIVYEGMIPTLGGLVTTGTVDASAGTVLVSDNNTVEPTGKSDGYIGVAIVGGQPRLYFTVAGDMYYIEGSASKAIETGSPMGLLLTLTYNLE